MPTAPSQWQVTEPEIKIAGTLLGGAIAVASVITHNEYNKVPKAIISIYDGSPADQTFAASEGTSPDLSPGGTVSIAFKDPGSGSSVTVFEGIIVSHAIRVRNRASLLVLECKDKAVKMTVGKNTACFTKKKDSEVIQTLIGNSGLSATVDATTDINPSLLQYDCSDWDFMVMRAEANGLITSAKAGAVSVKKPSFSGSASYSLTYGNNIIEVEAEADARTQVKGAKANSWAPANQDLATSTKTAPATTVPDKPGNFGATTLAGVASPAQVTQVHLGQLTTAQLGTWAEARMLKSRMARVKGRIKTYGFDVWPGDILNLDGVGARFDGDVLVTGVHHSLIGGEWLTEVQMGLSDRWHSELVNLHGVSHDSHHTLVPGLAAGVVKAIVEDPDSEYRVQVTIKTVAADADIWARMVFVDAGSSRGHFYYPEINDEVIIGFMGGDMAFPVILGQLYSSKATPPLTPDKKNDQKGIFTRSGMKVLFDDKDKSILMSTPGGNTVKISDQDKTIALQDLNSNKVTCDTSGITLDTPKDITLKATGNINLQATQAINIKATTDCGIQGMNVNVQAQIAGSLKGATVEVNGSGMATIKGGMVMIN
ncbi:MAG: type VI secretion system tip protein VgrG [Bacteroidia bacterium]